MAIGIIRTKCLDLLAIKPLTVSQTARILNIPAANVAITFNNMRVAGEAVVIGNAKQAGYADCKGNAWVYAVTGTPLLPDFDPATLVRQRAKPERPASGRVAAGRPYVQEFRALSPDAYDLQSHRRLAERSR